MTRLPGLPDNIRVLSGILDGDVAGGTLLRSGSDRSVFLCKRVEFELDQDVLEARMIRLANGERWKLERYR